ncbi:ComEC/Rec2 family competence protein [candidate division CSSED10-310 bacterium]|uniref:ComEC/Rec2 family competence protein n=1 Tax=candidate division CSSED10-310 bacterium TaxID=2855610 RepID=A0ABV6YVY9_UNCC1
MENDEVRYIYSSPALEPGNGERHGLSLIFRKESFFILALVVLVVLGMIPLLTSDSLFVAHSSREDAPPELLKVVFFDVHQGDAVLISTSSNKHFLIDGGQGASKYASFDAGTQVIIPYLKKHKIKKLDQVIMTHPHADHVGGLVSLLEQIPVTEVIDPAMSYGSSLYKRFLLLIESKGIQWTEARDGHLFNWDDDVTAQVMGPKELFEGTRSDANNNSVVIKVMYKATSFLFTGDAESESELDLLDYRANLRANVLKVPHHGGEFSSTEEFVRMVRPMIAVISCGRNNKFGHPHADTLEKYRRIGAKIVRTDLCGTITMLSDGQRISISTEKTCK